MSNFKLAHLFTCFKLLFVLGVTTVSSSSKDPVPSKVLENIKSLLQRDTKTGINLGHFCETYAKVNNDKPLQLSQYGYDHTLLFVLDFPEIMK